MFFFFNDTATTEIYTLSLHDALPILFCIGAYQDALWFRKRSWQEQVPLARIRGSASACLLLRSEEHTSELQSRLHLVCRLLLEKKKNNLHGSPAAIRSLYVRRL